MKKSFAFISLFLLLGVASIFADVTVKKLPDGNVEVYFFYANPRASEVLLAGDFTDWQSGALAMTKTDKGFELTKTFKPTDELRYKFISDGNWTTDLKAPDFVDDGFGGKNSHVVIADMIGGDGGDGAAKAKINFISWTMIGTQAKFKLQSRDDATKKGFALNGVFLGMKSYNKFAGNFLPNCPVYVEIALAETEIENEYKANDNLLPLISVDDYGTVTNNFGHIVDLISNPVHYIANTTDNAKDPDTGNYKPGTTVPGPGSRPFLGHLKFGFNTPYINYVTGFNYAKPDVRDAILWTTVSGNWDAGYQHIGGFSVFSLGDKVVAALQEATGLKFDLGFAPNKTADRKGSKYGYWGWAGISNDTFALDFQSNGMYNGDAIFQDAVEHDFILGAKIDQIGIGEAGKLNVAAQALVATHQKTSADIAALTGVANVCDFFGYSTDAFYRDGKFGLGNIAAQASVSYKQDYNEYRGKYLDQINASLSYRMRGYEASMLYVRENHDDGTFDLSEQLGVLNSQNIDLSVTGTVQEKKVEIGLDSNVEMPLAKNDGFTSDSYWNASGVSGWYKGRCGDDMEPKFGDDPVKFKFKPNVKVELGQFLDNAWGGSLSAYATLNLRTSGTYEVSDSAFRFKNAGLTYSYTAEDKEDVLKGMTVYYGLDNSNTNRMFNTLIAQCFLPWDITVTVGAGLKTINNNSTAVAAGTYANAAVNNPFGAVVGVSKKLASMKKPVIYAQFVYNMDCFKNFGDGQDNLALSGANVSGRWDKEAQVGDIDAVDFYDGKAAIRVGIRWDI